MVRAHYPEIENPHRYSKQEVDDADIIVDWHFGCHLPDWFGGACASLTDRYPNYKLVCNQPTKQRACSICVRPTIILNNGPILRQAPESTIGQPMAVYWQGIYAEYSVEYSKCHALNGILVLIVDDCRMLN
eukprot:385759-Prorocentrum_minimum.AAC.2